MFKRRLSAKNSVIFFVIVLIIVLGYTQLSIHSSGNTQTHLSQTTTSYHVSGNKILTPAGTQFVPYGFVVWCLSSPNPSCNQHTTQYPNSDSDKINTSASFWHANVVRIQVADQNLYSGKGGTLNTSFVSELDGEVKLANSRGMVVIISLQTERFNGSLMPDSSAVQFWNYISKHYSTNPKVFFDLFNEPRLNTSDFDGSESNVWSLWQNGGTITLKKSKGSTTYVGMQTLVNTIRANASNIIIAEGNHGDHDLSQLTSHLLSGGNIAYGQEPDLSSPSANYSFWTNSADENQAEWAANWGNLSDTYPIMIEAFQDHPGSFCYNNSEVVFPQLLSYLQSKNLGMIFYSLDPGLAVSGNNLTDPTSFSNGTFDCTSSSSPGTGLGADLLTWFTDNSKIN